MFKMGDTVRYKKHTKTYKIVSSCGPMSSSMCGDIIGTSCHNTYHTNWSRVELAPREKVIARPVIKSIVVHKGNITEE